MNNDKTQNDTQGLASLLERIKDNLTGDQCAAIGIYALERHIEALAASHCALVSALELAVKECDFTVSAMAQGHTVSISSLQNCAAAYRKALSDARNLTAGMEGGRK